MKKIDFIDALRGLAILGVIMVHTNQNGKSNLPNILEKVIAEGARGVQLFFLASAFTLFLSFKNRLAKEKFPIKNFFIRRFFRIAPIYYLGILYYFIQDGLGARYWLGDETNISFLNILSNLTFLHGFNPYWINSLVPGGWSIAVEMTFYAVLPFLFSKINNINQAFNLFLISIIGKLFLHILFFKLPIIGSEILWNEYLFLYFPSQLPIFSLGILMYFMVIENQKISEISGKSTLIFSVILLAELGTGTKLILPNHIFFGIGFLILAIALNQYRFFILVNPIIKYIGNISFSLYIVHFAVLFWLAKLNFINYFENGIVNYLARFLLVITISIIISTVLYRCIEIPFQNLSKKYINKLENKIEKNTCLNQKHL